MAYITDIINKKIEPMPDRITLERYIIENSFITKYLSRIIKDKALVVYQVLFYLSYYETGKSKLIIPWTEIGKFIRSEQDNIIEYGITVRRRLPPLVKNQCITVNRQRGGANEIIVHLPSEIPVCKKLIEKEKTAFPDTERIDDADYYSTPERKLMLLERDKRKCVYCLIDVSEDTYVLDHIVSVSKGGTNKKFNLVVACAGCNQRKQDEDAIQFLQSNYRNHFIKQDEYLKQKSYLENLLNQQDKNKLNSG